MMCSTLQYYQPKDPIFEVHSLGFRVLGVLGVLGFRVLGVRVLGVLGFREVLCTHATHNNRYFGPLGKRQGFLPRPVAVHGTM